MLSQVDAASLSEPWRYETRRVRLRNVRPVPEPVPPPFSLGDFMSMFGAGPGPEEYKGVHIKKISVKDVGNAFKKAGTNLEKGFESTGKNLAASATALGKCKPSDVKCIGKNLGNAIKDGVELAVPISTAVASEVGNGNPDAGYKKIGKQLYSITGIEGIVNDVKAIKACGGNAACIAKNLGQLLAAVAAMASNAIPGVGEAADAAEAAGTAAQIALKAEKMAQEAQKIAKTEKELKHAVELEKAAKEAKELNTAAKESGDVEKQKSALEKFKKLNDKMQSVQQNTQDIANQAPVADSGAQPTQGGGITGTEVAEGAAALAAGGALAYGASKVLGGRGGETAAAPVPSGPVVVTQPAPTVVTQPAPTVVTQPAPVVLPGAGFPSIELNIQVAGEGGVLTSGTGDEVIGGPGGDEQEEEREEEASPGEESPGLLSKIKSALGFGGSSGYDGSRAKFRLSLMIFIIFIFFLIF